MTGKSLYELIRFGLCDQATVGAACIVDKNVDSSVLLDIVIDFHLQFIGLWKNLPLHNCDSPGPKLGFYTIQFFIQATRITLAPKVASSIAEAFPMPWVLPQTIAFYPINWDSFWWDFFTFDVRIQFPMENLVEKINVRNLDTVLKSTLPIP